MLLPSFQLIELTQNTNKTAKSIQMQKQLQTKLSRSEFAETLADQKCLHAYSSTAQAMSHITVAVKALV